MLIQTPAYPPFYGAVRDSGRKLVENPLKLEEGVYRIDFDDLEQKCAEAKLMIFCNPHNPTGRVWSEEELRRVGAVSYTHLGIPLLPTSILRSTFGRYPPPGPTGKTDAGWRFQP